MVRLSVLCCCGSRGFFFCVATFSITPPPAPLPPPPRRRRPCKTLAWTKIEDRGTEASYTFVMKVMERHGGFIAWIMKGRRKSIGYQNKKCFSSSLGDLLLSSQTTHTWRRCRSLLGGSGRVKESQCYWSLQAYRYVQFLCS